MKKIQKKFQVISKESCSRCAMLKSWLKTQKIPYEELHLEDESVKAKLLVDNVFIENFCDIEGCMVYTPLIHLDGKYYFKELFGIDGIRENFVKKLLDIK